MPHPAGCESAGAAAIGVNLTALPWFCINTHAKKEFLAQTHCAQQGFEVFLPVYLHSYPRLGERLLPLFPGYLFVRFDPDNDRWGPLMHSRGVKRLFTNISNSMAKRDYATIRPVPVSDGLIHALQQQIIEPPARAQIPVIAPGAKVRVTGGHFQDQIGICAWSNAKRVALLLQVMSGQVECSFDRTTVELVD